LRTELPRRLAPQLEQLARDLTARLSEEAATQRREQTQLLQSAAAALQDVRQQAEEATARLKAEGEQTEAQIASRAEACTQALNEAAHWREEAAAGQHEMRSAEAKQVQEELAASLSAAQSSLQVQVATELEAAKARWQQTIESSFAEAQDRVAGSLKEQTRSLIAELQDEMARHAAAARDSAAGVAVESEQRLVALQQTLQGQLQRLEEALGRARESSERLEHFSERIENAQQQALGAFQSQLDDVLSLHRNELHRGSELSLEEINKRIHAMFEDSTQQALEQFRQKIEELVQPPVSRTEEALHRLAGERSLLDAALTLQQDRIRNSADEAFRESLAHFRENLGGVEQILQESTQAVTGRNLAELEEKISEIKHQVIEELFKSAEWYEKKAQTQIQSQTDRGIEQTTNQLREKAGEISSVFASELDHSSRNFVGHAQTQMEENVRESFEKARALFAEAADTTAAAFTDEIQHTGRQELEGYGEELRRLTEQARTEMHAARAAWAEQVTGEQAEFLQRFQAAIGGAVETGVTEIQKRVQEGFGPLLEAWKSMTDAHQKKMQDAYSQVGEQAVEQHKNRLENVSNQWMLATVASLDHQSRDLISGIAANAEERLREVSAQVFVSIGESLRERLKEMASSLTLSPDTALRAKSANTGK
jgi:hypothetical protein